MIRLVCLLSLTALTTGCWEPVTFREDPEVPYEAKGEEVQTLLEKVGRTPEGKVPPSKREKKTEGAAH